MEYKLSNFEGPLDLLLQMLSKNKVEIKDVFVTNIIDQFLDVINNSEEKHLEEMSEFVYIASKLLYIKSKKMLPTEKETAKELEDEFLRQVFEYSKIKEIIGFLKQQYEVGSRHIEKPPEIFDVEPVFNHSVDDIMRIANAIMTRCAYKKPPNEKEFEQITEIPEIDVDTVILELEQKLGVEMNYFSKLLGQAPSKMEKIVVFLAILSLCRDGKVKIEQIEQDISVIKR